MKGKASGKSAESHGWNRNHKSRNAERGKDLNTAQRYNLSFEAHYRLVTIHPWADGNGRMARLVMNHLQFEFGLVPTKVLKEDKGDYINALINTRESGDITIFQEFMVAEMVKTLTEDIDLFVKSTEEESREKKLKSREKILELLRIHPEYTMAILANELGVTTKAIEKQLATLKKEGLLRREGSDRKGRWVVE